MKNSTTFISGCVTGQVIAFGIIGRSQRRKGVALSGLVLSQVLHMHGLFQGREDGE